MTTDNPLMKGMVELLKNNFEGTCQSLALMQEQSEKISKLMAEQGTAMQTEGKKCLEQWVEVVKKSQQDYQNKVREQLGKLENLVGGGK